MTSKNLQNLADHNHLNSKPLPLKVLIVFHHLVCYGIEPSQKSNLLGTSPSGIYMNIFANQPIAYIEYIYIHTYV